jgi:hypothetical protein
MELFRLIRLLPWEQSEKTITGTNIGLPVCNRSLHFLRHIHLHVSRTVRSLQNLQSSLFDWLWTLLRCGFASGRGEQCIHFFAG